MISAGKTGMFLQGWRRASGERYQQEEARKTYIHKHVPDMQRYTQTLNTDTHRYAQRERESARVCT